MSSFSGHVGLDPTIIGSNGDDIVTSIGAQLGVGMEFSFNWSEFHRRMSKDHYSADNLVESAYACLL